MLSPVNHIVFCRFVYLNVRGAKRRGDSDLRIYLVNLSSKRIYLVNISSKRIYLVNLSSKRVYVVDSDL